MSTTLGVSDSTLTNEKSNPTTAEIYGYGTIAIAIISALSLLGVCLLPCIKKRIYEKILIVLTGLAIGTLVSDAVLHILPELFKMSHDEEVDDKSKIVIKGSVPFSCVILFTIYLLWILETVFHKFGGGHSHSHSHGNSLGDSPGNSHGNSNGNSNGNSHGHFHDIHQLNYLNSFGNIQNRNRQQDITDSSNQNEELSERKKFCSFKFKNIKSTAWILILSTFIHNLCDGLAVGASFADSMSTGISTAIAIVCHEIPHEIGDYALFIRFGFNHLQALFINFLTSISCYIGFYVGASIAETTAPDWILCVTAGTFIYIALVELIPSLPFQESSDWTWTLFICVNLAMLTGFAIMFLLVVFEEHIFV